MFIFEKPNIFLKFFIESSEKYCFVFSNLLGLAHLETAISDDSLFSQFLLPHEIFEKLSAKISRNFFCNEHSGISSPKWTTKYISIYPNDEILFFPLFNSLIENLHQLLGKDNTFVLYIDKFEYDTHFYNISDDLSVSERNIHVLNLLEYYYLNQNIEPIQSKISNKSKI